MINCTTQMSADAHRVNLQTIKHQIFMSFPQKH